MEKNYKSKPVQVGRGVPSDEALLDVIESNVLRLSGNDNSAFEKPERVRLGFLGSVTSALALAGVMVVAVFVLVIYRLVPSENDSHY